MHIFTGFCTKRENFVGSFWLFLFGSVRRSKYRLLLQGILELQTLLKTYETMATQPEKGRAGGKYWGILPKKEIVLKLLFAVFFL